MAQFNAGLTRRSAVRDKLLHLARRQAAAKRECRQRILFPSLVSLEDLFSRFVLKRSQSLSPCTRSQNFHQARFFISLSSCASSQSMSTYGLQPTPMLKTPSPFVALSKQRSSRCPPEGQAETPSAKEPTQTTWRTELSGHCRTENRGETACLALHPASINSPMIPTDLLMALVQPPQAWQP